MVFIDRMDFCREACKHTAITAQWYRKFLIKMPNLITKKYEKADIQADDGYVTDMGMR